MGSITGWEEVRESERCEHGVPLRARCTECADQVHQTRVIPGSHANAYALCTCGWVGPTRGRRGTTIEDAYCDANEHVRLVK